MFLDYFSGSMENVLSKKLCFQIYHGMSGLSFVWILRHFSGDICFIFTCPFRSVINIFHKEPSTWFVILVAGFRIISPHWRYSGQICSIVLGLRSSFLMKFAQGPTQSCWQDMCDPYFWDLQLLWSYCLWLAVFTVLRSSKGGSYGIKISQKHQRLVFVLVC